LETLLKSSSDGEYVARGEDPLRLVCMILPASEESSRIPLDTSHEQRRPEAYGERTHPEVVFVELRRGYKAPFCSAGSALVHIREHDCWTVRGTSVPPMSIDRIREHVLCFAHYSGVKLDPEYYKEYYMYLEYYTTLGLNGSRLPYISAYTKGSIFEAEREKRSGILVHPDLCTRGYTLALA
ncbi:MAG: hypothetical protein M1829_005187, partial [Trizodia sp. TS-e1964]